MSWLLMALTAWAALAMPLALVIGRSIRHADEVDSSRVPDFLPADWTMPATGSR